MLKKEYHATTFHDFSLLLLGNHGNALFVL
nr:MAG TPA: hypothetical protein [Caudoviricetes sp.]